MDELSAFLSEMDAKVFQQEKPKEIFEHLLTRKIGPPTYRVGVTLGLEALLNKVGYREFILREEMKNGKLTAADISKKYDMGDYYLGTGKEAADYFDKLELSLTDEEVKRATGQVRDIFKHRMLPKVVGVPQEAVFEIEKKMK